jgi:hypothetical protein
VVAALKKIDKFDGNGMLPEVGPASKRPPTCFLLTRVQGGKWARFLSPPAPKFRCDNSAFVAR